MLILGLVVSAPVAAQVIDDSTRVLYSPKTTLQLYERDVLQGRYIEQRVDTSINNMYNERYWFHDTTFFQHLGNVGTAAQPLLFRMQRNIGVRYGKNAFDRYAYDAENINYFDTRSPYSHLYYVQGQRGETLFEGTYARNITPRLNAGIAYQILTANKQLGPSNDGLIDNQAVKAFTHYRSKNKRYDLFANFTHLNQEQIEQGGIRPGPEDTQDSLFRYELETVYLNQAASQEMRNKVHALQILKLAGENLKVYHTLDWQKQSNEYQDSQFPTGDELNIFYKNYLFDSTRTKDETSYRELQNAVGFTGNTDISFYQAYIKHRNARINYSVLQALTIGEDSVINQTRTEESNFNQILVGGQLRLNYGKKALILVDGEFQLTRDYRVLAQGKLGPFTLSQEHVQRSPSLVEQRMLSNHFEWRNDFTTEVTDQSRFGFESKLGERQFLRLGAHYTNIKRHIFFNEEALPQQLSGNQRLYGAELTHHIRFGGLHFENFVAYTNTDKAETIRIPEWLVDSKLYFQGFIFKKALLGQIGAEMYLPTGYKADAYMPVTQQFYLQNGFQVKTYPVVDVFIAADIRSLNVFLKMSNVGDELFAPGYFVTPYYTGMRRSFVFGLKWMFFD
nr:putative porin [Pontibacter ruber]